MAHHAMAWAATLQGDGIAANEDAPDVHEVGPGSDESSDADHSGDNRVPVEVLGGRICALATRIAQATFHFLSMIAEFDERSGWNGVGIKSCAHWLSWTCSMAPGTAREHVRVARALRELPLVREEMAAGRLSYAKVRELTRVADRVDEKEVDEKELVRLARTATASQLARTVRAYRRACGARGRQEITRKASWFTDEDGSVVLSARLPAEEGAVVMAALEAARDQLNRADAAARSADADGTDADSTGSAGPHDDCGDAANRGAGPADISAADAVLEWARGYVRSSPQDRSGEDRTMVVVHVAAEHLDPASPADGPDAADGAGGRRSRGNVSHDGLPGSPALGRDCCEVSGVGGIEPATAQRLACDAMLAGVIRGRGGRVLAHGRRRRVVSEQQRRALLIRDRGCQFPGCTRATHLEAHHVTPWSAGGRTDMENLVLLCRFHHVACHEGGVILTPTRGDTVPNWHFATADGEPIAGSPPRPGEAPGWKHNAWILWHELDGRQGWNDPEGRKIRPLWAGERFSLADTVSALFHAAPRGDRGGNTSAAAA